jgi:ATP-dependent RNA helicase DeaD
LAKRRKKAARQEGKPQSPPKEGHGGHPRKKKARRHRHKKPIGTGAAADRESGEADRPTPRKRGQAKQQKAAHAKSDREAAGFAALGLSAVMMDALAAADYLEPTPVQAGLIPRAMEGVDVMGQAKTGTGKTAAFAIPILERLELGEEVGDPQAIVLAPTRELAVQVRDEFVKLASGRDVSIVGIYGGKPLLHQTEQLRRGADVIVGTPGRILDHMGRGTLRLDDIRFVVLDEADRMLDIGFRPDIEKILRRCPQKRQTLLLSATIPPPVQRLAQRYMHEPESLDFSPKEIAVETIEQFYFTVDPERKFDLLVRLLEREDAEQAIIFCRTRRATERIGQRLAKKIAGVASIHGDLPQRTRDSVMAKFREGRVRYLVATDVVGRGIDVTRISHIVNYDIPQFCDDYVHRVGRTGRMGREGVAYTFVSPEEGNELTRIEMRINLLLKRDEIPGFESFLEPDQEEDEPPSEAKPVFGRRQRRHRRAL